MRSTAPCTVAPQRIRTVSTPGRSKVQSVAFGVAGVSGDDNGSWSHTTAPRRRQPVPRRRQSRTHRLGEHRRVGVQHNAEPVSSRRATDKHGRTQGPSTPWPMGTFARDAYQALTHQQAATTHARQELVSRANRLPADARSQASVRTPWWRCRESNPGPCRIFPFFYVRSRAVAVSAPALCTALRGGGPVTVWFSARSRDRSDW